MTVTVTELVSHGLNSDNSAAAREFVLSIVSDTPLDNLSLRDLELLDYLRQQYLNDHTQEEPDDDDD